MEDRHDVPLEVIDAFMDGERVDADALKAALADSSGRDYLVDAWLLREAVQAEPVSEHKSAPPPRQSPTTRVVVAGGRRVCDRARRRLHREPDVVRPSGDGKCGPNGHGLADDRSKRRCVPGAGADARDSTGVSLDRHVEWWRLKMLSALLASALLLQTAASGAQPAPVPANSGANPAQPAQTSDWVVVVAAAIYQPDGGVMTETALLPAAGAGLIHVFARKSVCEPASRVRSSRRMPDSAGESIRRS